MKIYTRKIRLILYIIILCAVCGSTIGKNNPVEQQKTTKRPDSPITLERDRIFVTFTNRHHPDNRIGYRIFEHTPIVYGPVPRNVQEADIDVKETTRLEKVFSGRPNVLIVKHPISEEHWIRQDWTFYMAPVEDGIDLLLLVETFEEGLPSYYGVQQCFRMGGRTNSAWRQKIARTPAFSEYDLWADEEEPPEGASLTWVRREGRWQKLPATRQTVGARTPLGVRIDNKRTQGKLMEKVGPYQAKMLEPIDDGLITRVNLEGTWVSGIFWEGTSHITNHHPADCLHAIVNIGDVPPHAKRAIRGKIYWFEGTKSDLEKHFQRDFSK
jgi:hypothetical protein